MTTKAERKAQARAERLEREQEAAAAASRRRRLTRLGGVLLLAVVVVAVAIAVSSGSSGKKGSSTPSRKAASTVNALLAGIPQRGNVLGKASAPVQVTVYEDLQCPVCKDFTLGAEDKLIAGEVRTGRVKLVFRSLQTATPDATTFQTQQQAALAAGRQNKLWHFVELFYHQQGQEGTGYVTESYLRNLAGQVPGLNQSTWLAARQSGALASTVSSDEALAQRSGFNSTPTIVVQGPKASPAPVAGAISYAELQRLVKQAAG
jgi:protein-disulfide isomerase